MSITTQTTIDTSTIAAAAINASHTLASNANAKRKLPTENQAKELASKAFAENSQGKELVGTAEQRMAYAVAIHMANLRIAKSNSPDLLCESNEDKRTVRKALAEHFVGPALPKKKLMKDKGGDTAIAMLNTDKAMRALVKRGQLLATIMAMHDLPWSSYDTEKNCLIVKADMLLPAGSTPMGRLAKDKFIPLDGRPVTFISIARNGDEFPDGANANVGLLLRCSGPKPEEREGDREYTKELTAAIDTLYTLLVEEAPDELMNGHDLKGETWNKLSAVLMKIDETRAAPSFTSRMDGEEVSKEAKAFAAKVA